MSIAIGIFNYNQGKFFSECFESVIQQSVLPDQIFVVDDGSQDGSREQILSLMKMKGLSVEIPVQLILDEENIGLTARLNQVLSYSTSDWVLWLAADDLLDTDALKNLSEFKELDLLAVFGNHESINETGRLLGRRHPRDDWRYSSAKRFIQPDYPLKETLKSSNFISGGMTLLRRSYLSEAGGYLEGHSGEDLELMLRLGNKFKVLYIDETIGYVRIVPGSQSRNHLRHIQDYATIVSRHVRPQNRKNYLLARLLMMRWILGVVRLRKIPVSIADISEISKIPRWLLFFAFPSALLRPSIRMFLNYFRFIPLSKFTLKH
jgi:glycosyltransferase involved in cell wall biosynthesis